MTVGHSQARRRPQYERRRFALAGMLGLLLAGPGLARSPADRDSTQAIVLRVLRYELLLGDDITPAAGLCIDQAMEHADDLPVGDAPGAQVAMDRLYQAADACSLNDSGGPKRLVGEVGASIQGALFDRLKSLPAARRCLFDSSNLDSLRLCIASATGGEPTPTEWTRWAALYNQQRRLR